MHFYSLINKKIKLYYAERERECVCMCWIFIYLEFFNVGRCIQKKCFYKIICTTLEGGRVNIPVEEVNTWNIITYFIFEIFHLPLNHLHSIFVKLYRRGRWRYIHLCVELTKLGFYFNLLLFFSSPLTYRGEKICLSSTQNNNTAFLK